MIADVKFLDVLFGQHLVLIVEDLGLFALHLPGVRVDVLLRRFVLHAQVVTELAFVAFGTLSDLQTENRGCDWCPWSPTASNAGQSGRKTMMITHFKVDAED